VSFPDHCQGNIEIAHIVRGEPPLRSLERYFVFCDCEPRGHHAELTRREFRRYERAGVPVQFGDGHPADGTTWVMSLDKWLRRRRAKSPKSAPPKKRVKATALVAAEERRRKWEAKK